MINNFIKTELREVKIIDFEKIIEGTEIKYYERTMYEDINEEWSWSYVGVGKIIYVCEDEIEFNAGGYCFNLSVEDLQDGFHKIEVIS